MNIENETENSAAQKRDPDLANAEAALKRAALKARELAEKNGTVVVISENGVIKEESPAL